MKHALSKAYEEWKDTADQIHPQSAMTEDNLPVHRYGSTAGLLIWFLTIVALTGLRCYAVEYSCSTGHRSGMIFLYTASFIAIIGHIYLNRFNTYRKLDLIIDWSKDGKDRKVLLLKLLIIAVTVTGGQIWGYLCAFPPANDCP
jgi:hypothetical protein